MGDPGPLTEEESTLGVQTATVDTLVTNALFDTALKGKESKKKNTFYLQCILIIWFKVSHVVMLF